MHHIDVGSSYFAMLDEFHQHTKVHRVVGIMNGDIGSTAAWLMNEDIGSTVAALMNEDIGSTVAG